MAAFGSQAEFQQDVTRQTRLTRDLWRQAFGEVGARIISLEDKSEGIDDVIARIEALGIKRVNDLIVDKAEAAQDLLDDTSTNASTILTDLQAAFEEATDTFNALITQLNADLAAVQTGGVGADQVIESGTRVFITPAQKSGLPTAFETFMATFLDAANVTAARAAIGAISLADVPEVTDAETLAGVTPTTHGLNVLSAGSIAAIRTLLTLGGAALLNKGATAALREYTNNAVITGDLVEAAAAIVAVAYAGTVTLDWRSFISAEITPITGAMVIANPGSVVPGTSRTLWLQQDGTGGRAVTWGSNFYLNGAVETAANRWTKVNLEARTGTHIVASAQRAS